MKNNVFIIFIITLTSCYESRNNFSIHYFCSDKMINDSIYHLAIFSNSQELKMTYSVVKQGLTYEYKISKHMGIYRGLKDSARLLLTCVLDSTFIGSDSNDCNAVVFINQKRFVISKNKFFNQTMSRYVENFLKVAKKKKLKYEVLYPKEIASSAHWVNELLIVMNSSFGYGLR